MKQKLLSILLTVLLFLSFPVHAIAAENLPMIIDNANILSPDEEIALENQAQQLRQTYEYDIVILTVDSLEGKSAQEFADDFYDEHGYGYDEEGSGLLFLLAMNEREWYISTCGKAIYTFTDYGIQSLGEVCFSYLDNENYITVFSAYLSFLPEYFHAYDEGAVIDGHADYSGNYYHGTREDLVYYEEKHPNILLSLVIGFVTASVVILIMRSSMNTKRKQTNASGYLKSGSFHLKGCQDLFLYSNVSKVRRQQTNTSSGSSSVHSSSGGRRHGGGGGRF